MPPYLSIGQAASVLQCSEWQILRLCQRKLLPELPRAGRFRIVPQERLSEIARALKAANYGRPSVAAG